MSDNRSSLQRARLGKLVFLVCFSLLPALAQQDEPLGQDAPPLGKPPALGSAPAVVADRRMTLDLVVSDKSGKPVAGLQEADFTLLDNKQPQKILSFQSGAVADQPVQVILLVDQVNTSFISVSSEREQIDKFLNRTEGDLPRPVSIAFLSDKGLTLGAEPTRDAKALLASFDDKQSPLRSINRSQGFYGASDRMQISLRAVEQLAAAEMSKPGRKLVIWVSPGWPLLSGPGIQLTDKYREGLFNSLVALSAELRSARITLYSVDPLGMGDAGSLRTVYYKNFVKGVKSPRQVQIGNVGLQVLAEQSGGRVLNSSNDVAGEIAECFRDATAFYTLTFDGLPGDGPNEYHALELKVDKQGLTAHTRTGYYAQP